MRTILIVLYVFVTTFPTYASDQNPEETTTQISTALALLRSEMKTYTLAQLKGQQLLQEMSWKSERMRSLSRELEGVREEISTIKQRLDSELEAKSQKFMPPTTGPEDPAPAGIQENIDKFTKDLEEARKRETEIHREIIECEAKLSELSAGLTQLEEEIRSR